MKHFSKVVPEVWFHRSRQAFSVVLPLVLIASTVALFLATCTIEQLRRDLQDARQNAYAEGYYYKMCVEALQEWGQDKARKDAEVP